MFFFFFVFFSLRLRSVRACVRVLQFCVFIPLYLPLCCIVYCLMMAESMKQPSLEKLFLFRAWSFQQLYLLTLVLTLFFYCQPCIPISSACQIVYYLSGCMFHVNSYMSVFRDFYISARDTDTFLDTFFSYVLWGEPINGLIFRRIKG